MTSLKIDNYNPPFLLKSKHFNTIIPALFRKVSDINYKRHRIETPDEDFIDFDISTVGANTTAIISHGLEGNSHKPYVKGMVKMLNENGIDAVATNFRACSGEPNRLLSSYHIGKTDDLALLIDYLQTFHRYKNIILIGFSLGGNITLKYLGEMGSKLSSEIKLAIAISVPCDLKASAMQLGTFSNFLYQFRFLRSLKKKALFKIEKFKNSGISSGAIKKCRNFYQYDNLFTAPVSGFNDAEDYWSKCSCKQFLEAIAIPTLIINALDDPFLTPACYPYAEAENNSNIQLEVPRFGGHVGFMSDLRMKKIFWHENLVKMFIKDNISLK